MASTQKTVFRLQAPAPQSLELPIFDPECVVPYESLTWPRLLLAGLFARKQYARQRGDLMLWQLESIHTVFCSVLSRIRDGKPILSQLDLLGELDRCSGTSYTSKRRFMIGEKGRLRVHSLVRGHYVPALLGELSYATLSPSYAAKVRHQLRLIESGLWPGSR